MNTYEYMKSQLEKFKLAYKIAKNRKGVTQKELSDIKSKVRYYETAVEAMKERENGND